VGADAYRCVEMENATACVEECVEGEMYGRRTQIVSSFPKDARCAFVRTANASAATRFGGEEWRCGCGCAGA
jgi:hypothetical protein